jgi:hypothetical protein
MVTPLLFVQIGGRVEGMEEIAESLFGKDGYWPREEINAVFENMREKRDVSSSDYYAYQTPAELHGHTYARVRLV